VTAYAKSDLPRRPGRPPCCSPEARQRIRELKDQGYSLRQIARVLNDEDIPTPMGQAQWDKSHVWRVLGTLYMQELETANHRQATGRSVSAPVPRAVRP